MKRTTAIIIMSLLITSCSTFFDVVSGVGSIFGGGSGTSVETDIDFQNGNNSHKISGSDLNDNEINNSSVAGSDQYNARQIVIHNDHINDFIFIIVVFLILVALGLFIYFQNKKGAYKIIDNKYKMKNSINGVLKISDDNLGIYDRFSLLYLKNMMDRNNKVNKKLVKMDITDQLSNLIDKKYVIDCGNYYKINYK